MQLASSKRNLYVMTITALSPKSYERDSDTIKRIRDKFCKHDFPNKPHIDMSSQMDYEVQPSNATHCLHTHLLFQADCEPIYDDSFKIYLKNSKVNIFIEQLRTYKQYNKYRIKDSHVDQYWTYNQYHTDLFQEG